jgi:undecaprenyl-diphosphatase
MSALAVVILAIVQGAAELLPVSSSAHVIVAAKLMGLDPTTPEMTLLLVALHAGTMVAVVVFFQRAWRRTLLGSAASLRRAVPLLVFSTLLTAAVGYPIKWGIERVVLRSTPHADIEMIFGNLPLISAALAAAGMLILYAGQRRTPSAAGTAPGWREAGWMGAVQGLCLPFRGFSRSGATISTGLILGADRRRVEEYSFALAVILTPPVVLREVNRLLAAHRGVLATGGAWRLFAPSVAGALLSFLAGLGALAWLSRWLERGRWYMFGAYCLVASGGVLALHLAGY